MTTPEPTLASVVRAWTRMGVLFNATPASDPVDLERLIADTARLAGGDPRLFICAASWLAEHHGYVDDTRLASLLGSLPDRAQAVAGALIDQARAGGQNVLPRARDVCRRLKEPELMYEVAESVPVLRRLAAANPSPVLSAWGLLAQPVSLKPSAVRPDAWIKANVPELQHAGPETASLAESRLRGVEAREELVDEAGGLLRLSQVADRLGVTPQAVTGRRLRETILAVPMPNGEWVYPACQFADVDLVSGIDAFVRAFADDVDPWTKLAVLIAPSKRFGGKSALELLSDGREEEATSIAGTYGIQG